jgi:hypothetical protein
MRLSELIKFTGKSNDGPSYFTSKNKSSNLISFSGNNEVIYHLVMAMVVLGV